MSCKEICPHKMPKEIKNGKGEFGAGIMQLDMPCLAEFAKYIKRDIVLY